MKWLLIILIWVVVSFLAVIAVGKCIKHCNGGDDAE